MSEKLTPARLQNLKPPATGVDELLDAPGLALRVFPSGKAMSIIPSAELSS
jgi:hypothetical protein